MPQSPSERRARQREVARAVRENRGRNRPLGLVPENIRRGVNAARMDYADRVISGELPRPAMGTLEARSLGSLAGKARWGKAPAHYAIDLADFFYHVKGVSK